VTATRDHRAAGHRLREGNEDLPTRSVCCGARNGEGIGAAAVGSDLTAAAAAHPDSVLRADPSLPARVLPQRGQ
jgi:hypothetical protein